MSLTVLLCLMCSVDPVLSRGIAIGNAIPDPLVHTATGEAATLELEGSSPLVVFIWKPGQDRSKKALRDLVALEDFFDGTKARAVGITYLPHGTTEERRRIARDWPVKWPLYFDPGARAYQAFEAFVLPTTFILDASGRLVVRESGYKDRYIQAVQTGIELASGRLTAEEREKKLHPEVVKVDPNHDKARRHQRLGEDLLRKGLFEQAEAELRSASDLLPDDTRILELVAQTSLALGRGEEALEIYEHLLDRNPDSVVLQAGEAFALILLGETEEGLDILESLAFYPSCPDRAFYELGRLYQEKGDYEKAASYYRKGMERMAPRTWGGTRKAEE